LIETFVVKRQPTARSEARTAQNSTIGQCFTTIDYSPDGAVLLAAGKSKYVCLYAVEQRLLLKKFQISYNLRLGKARRAVAGSIESV
jgi:hypothetical protein